MLAQWHIGRFDFRPQAKRLPPTSGNSAAEQQKQNTRLYPTRLSHGAPRMIVAAADASMPKCGYIRSPGLAGRADESFNKQTAEKRSAGSRSARFPTPEKFSLRSIPARCCMIHINLIALLRATLVPALLHGITSFDSFGQYSQCTLSTNPYSTSK